MEGREFLCWATDYFIRRFA